MEYRKYIVVAAFMLTVLSLCAGCGRGNQKEDPVTVTIWHVYGGQTDSPLNDLIEEFNRTTGAEENIRVKVSSVSNTNTIHEGVLSAAFGDPGAPELPDMFVSYPKTVLAMPDDSILVDYRDYFSDEEIGEFLPVFIDEGIVNGRLVVLPVAKSTEILYVNKTAFDRFAADTGASLSDLETWEGLYDTASVYVKWTDDQTPQIPDDGKAFFVHDYHFNYFQVGVESLGEEFFDGDTLMFGPAFETVWEPYAEAALQGGVWLEGGYATDSLRTGDTIVSVASSASVLYYSDTVTYADNTSEQVEIVALPCPVFKGGEKLVMQRGAGICTVKSTPERERACMTFLKWLTDAERNVEFVTRLGYMPVKQESFDTYLKKAIEELKNPMYVSLYEAFLKTREDYTFYTAPQMENYLDLETRFEKNVRYALKCGRAEHLAAGTDTLSEQVRESLIYFKGHY